MKGQETFYPGISTKLLENRLTLSKNQEFNPKTRSVGAGGSHGHLFRSVRAASDAAIQAQLLSWGEGADERGGGTV